MDENPGDGSQVFLESSRFWIQRVLVPIIVLVGVGGNTASVVVLTRKRMRCSTNIYLTALAVADVIYLLFVLLLSFQHYPNVQDTKYVLYWRFFGLTHWLCDAASSTSVWLTVSFTLERYIAVCHPIKGKVLCTENRAKSIIVIVTILCVLTTASTAFEYQLALHEKCIRKCTPEELRAMDSSSGNNIQNDTDFEDAIFNITDFGNETCCDREHTTTIESTNMGNNIHYKTAIYWFSAIVFGLLPLILIATFNCFLINAVYRSQIRRRRMTNSQLIQQENTSMANENRITVMLIGIVMLFLICQTPTASFLIYDNFDESKNPRTINIKRGLGNIFNFLLNLNAAGNFLLYCVLSKKYRATFREIFWMRRRKKRQDTIELTTTRTSHRFNPFPNGLRRNISEYHTPRNLETLSLTSIPRSKSLMVRSPGKSKSSDLIV